MATEKIEVTANPSAYAKEVGDFGSDDAELHASNSSEVDISSRDTLEVRLLDFG